MLACKVDSKYYQLQKCIDHLSLTQARMFLTGQGEKIGSNKEKNIYLLKIQFTESG